MLTETIERRAVAAFFDERADAWDARRNACAETLDAILDLADVRAGHRVLDVGCGTGVLFPRCLARGVSRLVGVDLSARMLELAHEKHRGAAVELLNADAERDDIPGRYDRALVLNALPHFSSPARLAARLSGLLEPAGRFTVAHDLGRDRLNRLHAREAGAVSRELRGPEELAAVFAPFFRVDAAFSDDRLYVVSGTRR